MKRWHGSGQRKVSERAGVWMCRASGVGLVSWIETGGLTG